MDEKVVLRAIRTTRQQLLAEYDDIDPTPQKTREYVDRLFGHGESLDLYAQVPWFDDYESLGASMTRLMSTPRVLKHALRDACMRWKQLHGEIYLDDLLVSSILRFGAREAFDFLLRRIDTLRTSKRATSSESGKRAAAKRREAIQADWNHTTARATEWDVAAARALIMFLLPDAAECFGDEDHVSFGRSPQGVQNYAPTDYWGRMLAGELPSEDLHDQTVLKSMREWAESPSSSGMPEAICSSSRFTEVWEYFAELKPTPNLLELAGRVLAVLRQRDGARASCDSLAMLALWRRAHATVKRDDNTRDWLIDQIARSMTASLRLANDLYYYFASMRYGVVKTDDDRKLVRERLFEKAKEAFSVGGEKALIQALDPNYPYSVRHLVCPADQEEPLSVLTRPSEWQWLSPVLLDAAIQAPTHVIPQIVFLVTDSAYDTNWNAHTQWDQTLLDGMFGNDLLRLMEVLSTEFQLAPVPSDPAAEAKVQNTRALAREWCKTYGSKSSG